MKSKAFLFLLIASAALAAITYYKLIAGQRSTHTPDPLGDVIGGPS